MTDTPMPPEDGDSPLVTEGEIIRDRVEPVDIQQEMQRSYIDYAMSVIELGQEVTQAMAQSAR